MILRESAGVRADLLIGGTFNGTSIVLLVLLGVTYTRGYVSHVSVWSNSIDTRSQLAEHAILGRRRDGFGGLHFVDGLALERTQIQDGGRLRAWAAKAVRGVRLSRAG